MKNNISQSKNSFLLRNGKWLLVLGVLLMFSAGAFAQDEFEGDPDDQVPFDGGISLLAAAGVAYGVKQWHNNRKQNPKENAAETDK